MTEEEIEVLAQLDIMTVEKVWDDIVNEDKSKPHSAFPGLNMLAAKLNFDTANDSEALYFDRISPAEMAERVVGRFYALALTMYRLGQQGHKILEIPCERDHEEDD